MKTSILSLGALSCVALLMTSVANAQEPAAPAKQASAVKLPDFSVFADFASRKISRGVLSNQDPIETYGFTAKWYGINFKMDWLFDLTDERGQKNECNELDYFIGYEYTFKPEEWNVPTAIKLYSDWNYEGHPGKAFKNFMHNSVSLPKVFLAPTLDSEFEFRKSLWYIKLTGKHSWTLVDAREEKGAPVLALTLSLTQGVGNAQRNKEDLKEDLWALRETTLKAKFDWKPVDHLTISPYIAYSDTFSGTVRDAARNYKYDDKKHTVAQLYGGVVLTASF